MNEKEKKEVSKDLEKYTIIFFIVVCENLSQN